MISLSLAIDAAALPCASLLLSAHRRSSSDIRNSSAFVVPIVFLYFVDGYTDERTMKVDIFMVGFVLLELIAKKKFTFAEGPYCVKEAVIDEAKRGEKYLVHEFFREVDHSTAFNLTLLAFQCVDFLPDKRPEMKDVLNALNAMSLRGVKRKIDHENEAEHKR